MTFYDPKPFFVTFFIIQLAEAENYHMRTFLQIQGLF